MEHRIGYENTKLECAPPLLPFQDISGQFPPRKPGPASTKFFHQTRRQPRKTPPVPSTGDTARIDSIQDVEFFSSKEDTFGSFKRRSRFPQTVSEISRGGRKQHRNNNRYSRDVHRFKNPISCSATSMEARNAKTTHAEHIRPNQEASKIGKSNFQSRSLAKKAMMRNPRTPLSGERACWLRGARASCPHVSASCGLRTRIHGDRNACDR